MIDVKNTILETIKDKIYKMRFLGQYDPVTFKHILYLIVLDDIYDWSDYLDEHQAILKKLQELRTLFILNHGEFIVKMTDQDNFYVNVNTPQTTHTWKRVWDAPDVKIIDTVEQIIGPTLNVKPFTPDPTCPVSLTYFGTGETIPADRYGKPSVDFDALTICEKMNIYINRETGQMFFLDPKTCTWNALKGEFASTVKWEDVDGRPEVIYNGISHTVITDSQCPENNRLNVHLTQDGTATSDITVTDSNPEITNTDLEGIL